MPANMAPAVFWVVTLCSTIGVVSEKHNVSILREAVRSTETSVTTYTTESQSRRPQSPEPTNGNSDVLRSDTTPAAVVYPCFNWTVCTAQYLLRRVSTGSSCTHCVS